MATTGHEGYVKLQAWVKQELWDELNSQGITSPTSAVTQGLQLLLDTTRNTTNNYQDTTALEATIEGLQVLLQEKQERIQDLSKQVDSMSTQLETKDEQITQLNEVTQKQAVHIQSLIQENSKLNTKLLPEVTEKKSWWMFWK